MVQKLGRTKKVIKVGTVSEKDDILTVEEIRIPLIGNGTKIILEMTPEQIELEARQLKVSNMRIKKKIEEEKELLSYIGGKIC